MYGPPPAMYEVIGRVSDGAGDAIAGIRIDVSVDSDVWIPDPVYSDAQGRYEWGSFADVGRTTSVTLTAVDVDGEANGGEFGSQSATVVFDGSPQTKEIDFVLEPIKEE